MNCNRELYNLLHTVVWRTKVDEKDELGSPLAVAAFEAVRALVWQAARGETVAAEQLARELENAAEDVSPRARELLLVLASTARLAPRARL